MAKGRKVRASRAAQGSVEFSHFPPAVHFDLIRKQAVVIPALSRSFFDSSEISESVNFCVMEAIKLCRLDTPIIFIEARINLSIFVVTGCAAKTSATLTSPSLNLISLFAFNINIWFNGVTSEPSLVSWIKHSVDRFVIVSIFIPKLRLILILNSFLGSSDSLVFSELFHSLAPRPLAARSISDQNVKKRPACSELRWAYCNHKATYFASYLTGGDCVPDDQN